MRWVYSYHDDQYTQFNTVGFGLGELRSVPTPRYEAPTLLFFFKFLAEK